MARSQKTLLIILLYGTLPVYAQKPPRDDQDYGHLERPIGLMLNTEEAWPGYTLFAPKHYTRTYLINNEGGDYQHLGQPL